MSHAVSYSSVRQLLGIAVLVLCFGFRSALGQEWSPKIEFRPRPGNPKSDRPLEPTKPRNNPVSASSDTPPESPAEKEKQETIRQSIETGNKARDENRYKLAIESYLKVKELDSKDERASYGMGNVYSDIYCNDSAIEAYVTALSIKPKYVDALLGLSYVYITKERYDDAWQRLEETLSVAPANVDAKITLGLVFAKKGQYQDAIARIRMVIDDQSIARSDRATAHLALGDVYYKQRKWKETIAEYENAIRLNPQLARAYVKLGSAQLSSAFAKFTSISSPSVQDKAALAASAKPGADNIQKAMIERGYNHPQGDLFLGTARLYQARYPEAVSEINKYLVKIKELENQLSPLDSKLVAKCNYGFGQLKSDGYWFLGFAHSVESDSATSPQRKTELLDQAIEAFKKAISLKEDSAVGYASLGGAYLDKGRYEEAIKQFERAIVFESDKSSQAGNYMMIGLAYHNWGRYEDAIQKYEDAIKLGESNPRVYDRLASSYEGLASKSVAKGNLDETFRWLTKAGEVRRAPATKPDPYYFLGATHAIRFMEKGGDLDFDQAVKWLSKAVEIDQTYAAAHQALGMVYQRHSMDDEALASYEKAIEYAQDDPANYVRIGEIYFARRNNVDAAIGRFRKAIEIKPDNAEAHWRLGLAYHYQKNDAEAIKQILEAIRRDPKALQAYFALATVYIDQKNFPEAIKPLNKAMELEPRDFAPYKEIARFYEAQQKKEEAISYYQQAIDNLRGISPFAKELYLCRIERLRSRYDEAVTCFQKIKVPASEFPATIIHDIGLTYVASKNKNAARSQYELLRQLKSPLAEDLLRQINEMK